VELYKLPHLIHLPSMPAIAHNGRVSEDVPETVVLKFTRFDALVFPLQDHFHDGNTICKTFQWK